MSANSRRTGLAALIVASLCAQAQAQQSEAKRIRGTAIERLLAGKEYSDGVHWRYSFRPDGGVVGYAMSRRQDLRWRVSDDSLCWRAEGAQEDCFEVWISGSSVQLLPQGIGTPFEGIVSRLLP
ncbi:hypothetical protein [Bosea sp. LjRoot237]|uniref:hypothetical protein n=1 Tax=Bosea sp. LjRoot237 TaxID=3342292 RepID=UPI003ECE9684